jgi:hypothetical protein
MELHSAVTTAVTTAGPIGTDKRARRLEVKNLM